MRNESLFREVNERIAEINEDFEVHGRMEFLCECGSEDCLETVRLSKEEYEAVRGEGQHFVVKPGHEKDTVEVVVERRAEYLIVAKVGEAGEEAQELDPR